MLGHQRSQLTESDRHPQFQAGSISTTVTGQATAAVEQDRLYAASESQSGFIC